jgi:hypothetical protein
MPATSEDGWKYLAYRFAHLTFVVNVISEALENEERALQRALIPVAT